VVGTESCRVSHPMHVVSGRMEVRMDDGTTSQFGPGDVGMIPPGHDAWIVGNDAFVGIDFQGGAVLRQATLKPSHPRCCCDVKTFTRTLCQFPLLSDCLVGW